MEVFGVRINFLLILIVLAITLTNTVLTEVLGRRLSPRHCTTRWRLPRTCIISCVRGRGWHGLTQSCL